MSATCLRLVRRVRKLPIYTVCSNQKGKQDCRGHGHSVDRSGQVHEKKHWPGDYNGIRDADNLKTTTLPPLKEMGGKYGPGNVIMISRNVGNSAHIEYADASRSIAFLG
jgi:hypothetical protein